MPRDERKHASVEFDDRGADGLVATIGGRLDAGTVGGLWREINRVLGRGRSGRLRVDASSVDYCDGAGVALFVELRRRQQRAGGEVDIQNLAPEFQTLLDRFDHLSFDGDDRRPERKWHLVEDIGQHTTGLFGDLYANVAFVGEVVLDMGRAVVRPTSLRWGETLLTMERAGVNALPIVALVGFLIGLILAFQSTTAMKQFGFEVYASDLVALAMFREMGPLMTAVILAGRSGSAFAAEIGAMKVDEEIDALRTMDLDPVRFLVTPRVVAGMIVTPLLAVFANLFGLLGGALVLDAMGYPLPTYMSHITYSANYVDLIGGLVKAGVFGLLVAGVGCLRGLRTKLGPQAVGDSTTSAVVSAIVLIVVADGVFALVYYFLGL